MRPHLKSVGLAVATLLISLAIPVSLANLPALAQASTSQSRQSEAEQLLQTARDYTQVGDYEKAIAPASLVIGIAREGKNLEIEGWATLVLARAYNELGDKQKAESFAKQARAIGQNLKNRGIEGFAVVWLADACSGTEPQKSIELVQQAIMLARESKNLEIEGWATQILAGAYRGIGENQKSIEFAQQAITTARKIKNREIEAWATIQMVITYVQVGEKQKALELAESTITTAREIKNRAIEGYALANLSMGHGSLGNYKQAISAAQQSLELSRELKNKQVEVFALSLLVQNYVESKEYTEAIEPAQRWIVLERELKDKQAETVALTWLAPTYIELKEYPKAIESVYQWVSLTRELKDKQAEATALYWLVRAYVESKEYAKAIEPAQQWVVLEQELKDKQSETNALYWLVRAYVESKEYAKAIEPAQQWVALERELKDKEAETNALNWLVRAYVESKEYAKAIEPAQQWVALAQELKNKKEEANALGLLVQAYEESKEYAKAIKYGQQLVTLTRELRDKQAEANALSWLVSAYVESKEYAKVIKPAQRWVVLTRELRDKKEETNALSWLVRAYAESKEHAKVIKTAQRWIALERELKNKQSEANALGWLARAYVESKEYTNGAKSAQQWIALAQKLKQPEDEIYALSTLARAYAGNKNENMANTLMQQAEAVARKIKPLKTQVSALLKLQYAYHLLNNTSKIEEISQQALMLANQAQDPNLVSEVNQSIIVYRFLLSGNIVESLEQYLNLSLGQKTAAATSANIVKEYDAENQLVLGLVLAFYTFLSDNYSQIEDFSNQYLVSVLKLKGENLEFGTLFAQGLFSWKKSDYVKTEALLDQFILKIRAKKEPDLEAIIPVLELLVFYATQNYQKVIVASEKVQELEKLLKPKTDSTENIAFKSNMLWIRAFSYAKLNEDEKAVNLLQQGIDLVEKSLVKVDKAEKKAELYGFKSQSLKLLADIYKQRGEPEKSIQAYREAVEIDLLASKSDSSKAEQKNIKSIWSYVGLGRVYQTQSMPVTAITYYKQAIESLEQDQKDIFADFVQSTSSSDIRLSSLAFANLSKLLRQLLLEKGVLGDLAGTKNADVYRELANLLLSQGRILEAQQTLELLKTQEIQDFTRSKKAGDKVNVSVTPKEGQIRAKSDSLIAFGQQVAECQQSTCSQLDQLLNRRDALVQDFDQQIQIFEKEFRDRSRADRDRAALAPQDFLGQAEEIVKAQPGTVLIYPLVLEDKTWVLWASKGVVVKSVEIPGVGQRQLGETVLKFRQLLQNPNSSQDEIKKTGKQLYDWLIKPIEPELRANQMKNLVFSLDRATRYIPMAALFDGEKYLVEGYTVSTVLSAGYTDMTPSGRTQKTQVLALGLSEAKAGFNSLPNVPTELDTIVRQPGKDKQGIYPGLELLNAAFDFSALRNYVGKYEIIHIATHGKFELTDPDQSFLLMGDGEPLRIPRIRTLQNLRNVSLVVLSACETALGGADRDGVEIAGISSYFLQKGKAKAVMASLWLVNDASTSLLMQQFYKQLATGKRTKAEALQMVQREFIKGKLTAKDAPARSDVIPQTTAPSRAPVATDFTHPYYWAPFILIGNSL